VTGGIGITPMQSICNDLIVQYFRGREIKKIKFIWAVRDRGMARAVADYKKNFWNKKLDAKEIPELLQKDFFTFQNFENLIDSEFYVTKYVAS
jgi:ferredoxin-NADP reductase